VPGSGGWGSGGDQIQPMQLYHLTDDVSETKKNLAAVMPERVFTQALKPKLLSHHFHLYISP
jgi:hypothetical protein